MCGKRGSCSGSGKLRELKLLQPRDTNLQSELTKWDRASEMAQGRKVLATKPDNLALNPRMVEGQNSSYLSSDLHTHPTHTEPGVIGN